MTDLIFFRADVGVLDNGKMERKASALLNHRVLKASFEEWHANFKKSPQTAPCTKDFGWRVSNLIEPSMPLYFQRTQHSSPWKGKR